MAGAPRSATGARTASSRARPTSPGAGSVRRPNLATVAPSGGASPLSRLYGETQARVVALVQGLDERDLVTPVPACPGWSVRDVAAHLTAVAEDVLEGRLTGPPSGEQTAAQVARFEDRSRPTSWPAGTTWRRNSAT